LEKSDKLTKKGYEELKKGFIISNQSRGLK